METLLRNGKAINWNGHRFNFRLNYQNGKIIDKEIILQGDIGRIRDFEIDEAGDFYVVVDDKDSFLWKITK